MASHVRIAVSDLSSVGEARRAASRLADAAGLDAADGGRAAIVATELATNLARHAGPAGGAVLLWGEGGAVEVTSVDAGPGMRDVARCFEDGFSTGGTPGTGLGAVRRQSDALDVFSDASGTVLWARVDARAGTPSAGGRPAGQTPAPLAVGAISVPAPGETVCGDAWRISREADGRIALMIADGLGHGPGAAAASDAACAVFWANPFAAPDVLIETMHAALAGTRGAAISVAQIDPPRGVLRYAGVGNIAGSLRAADGAGGRGMFSHNGTVGHLMRKVQMFEYPWAPSSLLLIHSDGLQTRWALDKYPGLARRHPAVIGGVLYRDFCRGRDDATIVVLGPPPTATL
jgi:anti-sigma regulatory factor (Ser/Thr protein kinase)